MKISNELKVGALTLIAIVILILGFTFLKGKSLFSSGEFLKTTYSNTHGLMPSNMVQVNGINVGTVYSIETTKDLKSVVVTLKLKEKYQIPDDSKAILLSSPLSGASIDIKLGKSSTFLESNGTIQGVENGGLFGELTNKIGPVTDQLTLTLHSLDTVLNNFNSILDPGTKGNLQGAVANVNRATAVLMNTSLSAQKLLENQSGSISASMRNLSAFTQNLADNNAKITETLNNLATTTRNLSQADIDGVINKLKQSSDNLEQAMAKLNTSEGSIGALINDRQLYNNINNTVRSLNILMDDLRVNPKRYVGISIFGRKDKGNYLTKPLADDSSQVVPEK